MKKIVFIKSDFARGQRTNEDSLYEANSDFACGQRALPITAFQLEDLSDFARGQRHGEKDLSIQSDFARGQRTIDVEEPGERKVKAQLKPST